MSAATKVREPVNGWYHAAGALLALAALAALLRAAFPSLRALLGAGTFGASAVLMFGASAVYHLRHRSPRASLYRRLDHAMIYVFIAGTYTAVCLVALWPSARARILLGVVWALALAGVTQEFRRGLPRGWATALYLALGWAALLLVPELVARPVVGLGLLAGGAFYTVGALIYWRKWSPGRPGVFGFHELWHVCVIAGSASHFWAIRHVLVAQG